METEVNAPGIKRQVLRAAEVAELLGCKEETFRNKYRTMEASGFPKKLPGTNGWSRPAVMRWIATNGETYLPAAANEVVHEGAQDVALSIAIQGLEDEYAGEKA